MEENNSITNNSNDKRGREVPEPISFEGKTDLGQDKERIEKSRKEVLEMIDKNKTEDKPESSLEGKKTKKSWFSSFFGASKDKKAATKKDEKKEIGEKKTKEEEKSGIKKEASIPDELIPAPPGDFSEDSIGDSLKEAEAMEKELDKIKSGKGFSGEHTEDYKKPAKDSPFVFKNKSWKSADVLETNLIDKNELGFFDVQKKYKYFTNSVLGVILFICILYMGILYWEHLELKRLMDKKVSINKMVNGIREKEKTMEPARIFQQKLDTSKLLLDKHVYWTNFFKFLEENTLAGVHYADGFEGGIDGTYDLTVRANSYEDIKNQLQVFADNELVLHIEADSPKPFEETTGEEIVIGEDGEMRTTSISSQGFETNVTIELDKSLFYKSYTNSGD